MVFKDREDSNEATFFSPSLRESFKRKRLALGLTQAQLAQYLKVSHSTIRKWEDGPVVSCRDCHCIRIMGFLNGEFDRELQGMKTLPGILAHRFKTMPGQIRNFIRKAAIIHTLSSNRADVRIALLNGIDGIIRRYAGMSLQTGKNDK